METILVNESIFSKATFRNQFQPILKAWADNMSTIEPYKNKPCPCSLVGKVSMRSAMLSTFNGQRFGAGVNSLSLSLAGIKWFFNQVKEKQIQELLELQH